MIPRGVSIPIVANPACPARSGSANSILQILFNGHTDIVTQRHIRIVRHGVLRVHLTMGDLLSWARCPFSRAAAVAPSDVRKEMKIFCSPGRSLKPRIAPTRFRIMFSSAGQGRDFRPANGTGGWAICECRDWYHRHLAEFGGCRCFQFRIAGSSAGTPTRSTDGSLPIVAVDWPNESIAT